MGQSHTKGRSPYSRSSKVPKSSKKEKKWFKSAVKDGSSAASVGSLPKKAVFGETSPRPQLDCDKERLACVTEADEDICNVINNTSATSEEKDGSSTASVDSLPKQVVFDETNLCRQPDSDKERVACVSEVDDNGCNVLNNKIAKSEVKDGSSAASVDSLPKHVVFEETNPCLIPDSDKEHVACVSEADDGGCNVIKDTSASSLDFPEVFSFEEESIIKHNSSPSRFHGSCSSRVSFATSVVTIDEEEDDRTAFGKLVTQTLWKADPIVVRSAVREFTRVILQSQQEEEDEDDLDVRHEALLLGGHLSLIRVLQTHLLHSDVLIEALQALLLMFEDVNVYWIGVLGGMGAMEAVVSTMTVKAEDLLVQEQVFRFLLLLLRVKENAVKFVELDGVAAMFRRLEAFPEDRETCLDVCSVIKKMCVWEHTRTSLMSSGAVSYLAGMIDRSSSSEGTSETSATTLTTTTEDGKAVHHTQVEIGSATSTILQDATVQSLAYDTMIALVAPRAVRSSRKGRELARVKGDLYQEKPPSPSSSLSALPEDEEAGEADCVSPPLLYQSYSTMIIRDLWSDCDEVLLTALHDITVTLSMSKVTYGKAFIEVGGPLAVTKVMEARRRSGAVQEAGCEILRTLVTMEGFPTILGEVGGVETLIEGIRNGSDVRFKKGAVKALAKMLKASTSNKQRFFASGGVPVLIQSMDLCGCNADFQELSCKILRLCCTDRSFKAAIIKSGGASAIARILETQDDPKATKAAKKTMKALIHDD